MQASRRRQVEMDGVPARLQKHGAKAVQRGGLFGDPQRVGQFLRLRDQQAGGIDAVEEKDARWIRIAGFTKAFGHADPKDGGLRSLERQADQRENKGGRGTRIARAGRMDLGKPGAGQAAAECGVETFRASDQKPVRHSATPDEVDILRTPVKAFGEAAFDFRDLMAQQRNGSLRHGRRGHDGQAFKFVPVMFLLIPEPVRRVKQTPREFIPVLSPHPFSLTPNSLETRGPNGYMLRQRMKNGPHLPDTIMA